MTSNLTMTNPKKKMYYNAFKIIFEKALEIKRQSDHVSIIYDETFDLYLDSITNVVIDLELSVTFIYLPIAYQELLIKSDRFNNNIEISLPNGTSSAISNSNIILTFLNANPSLLKVRSAILNEKPLKGCKISHCPGISDEILGLVIKSPYSDIFRHTEMFAWVLGNSKDCTLITHDRQGQEYRLSLNLQGWDNEPIMSPGVIIEGNWGNISPGEAFCCPEPLYINGAICINGSLPGIVLKKNEETILFFVNGKLINWISSKSSRANVFLKNLELESNKNKDIEWNTFAELGIGLNPVIKKLTGNSLFDEKMAGTIHIAIGDNVIFGHPIQSKRHIDMVVLRPTLMLDGKIVIKDGHFYENTIIELRKNNNYSEVDYESIDRISLKAGKIKIINNSIKRRLKSGNRIGFVDIVEYVNIQNLLIIQEILIKEDRISIHDLRNKIPNNSELNELLQMLNHYKVIKIHKIKNH